MGADRPVDVIQMSCWHDAQVADPERIKAEVVSYYRGLDEAATLRCHFRGADDAGGLWYFEVVPVGSKLTVIKQAELTSAGTLHRYSWEHLADEHGFLTDQPIDPDEDPFEVITPEEFERVWIDGAPNVMR
jgi:hypothetical protein